MGQMSFLSPTNNVKTLTQTSRLPYPFFLHHGGRALSGPLYPTFPMPVVDFTSVGCGELSGIWQQGMADY